MECLEDGELPSSPEEPLQNQEPGVPSQPIYTPLPRPKVTPSSKTKYADNTETFSGGEIIKGTANISTSTHNFVSGQMTTTSDHHISSSGSDSSTEDSDSDSHRHKATSRIRSRGKKLKRFRVQEVNPQISETSNNGGEDFQNAVKAYQHNMRQNNGILSPSYGREKRKGTSKNDVWGSILKEDALTSDLTSIAVGRKSVKDLNSDRGAEVISNR